MLTKLAQELITLDVVVPKLFLENDDGTVKKEQPMVLITKKADVLQLSENDRGNKLIPVKLDLFLQMCRCICSVKPTSRTLAKAVFRDWIYRFGVPLEIQSGEYNQDNKF